MSTVTDPEKRGGGRGRIERGGRRGGGGRRGEWRGAIIYGAWMHSVSWILQHK